MACSCPICRSTASKTTNTKHRFVFLDGTRQMATFRQRKCERCGEPFKTIETTILERSRLHVAGTIDVSQTFENNSHIT